MIPLQKSFLFHWNKHQRSFFAWCIPSLPGTEQYPAQHPGICGQSHPSSPKDAPDTHPSSQGAPDHSGPKGNPSRSTGLSQDPTKGDKMLLPSTDLVLLSEQRGKLQSGQSCCPKPLDSSLTWRLHASVFHTIFLRYIGGFSFFYYFWAKVGGYKQKKSCSPAQLHEILTKSPPDPSIPNQPSTFSNRVLTAEKKIVFSSLLSPAAQSNQICLNEILFCEFLCVELTSSSRPDTQLIHRIYLSSPRVDLRSQADSSSHMLGA